MAKKNTRLQGEIRKNYTLNQVANIDAPPGNDQVIMEAWEEEGVWVAHVWKYTSLDSFRNVTLVAPSQTLCKELALSILVRHLRD